MLKGLMIWLKREFTFNQVKDIQFDRFVQQQNLEDVSGAPKGSVHILFSIMTNNFFSHVQMILVNNCWLIWSLVEKIKEYQPYERKIQDAGNVVEKNTFTRKIVTESKLKLLGFWENSLTQD